MPDPRALDAVRETGDVRILLLNGEIVGAMRRTPHGTDFRANMHAGGTCDAHQVTAAERRICAAIMDRLVADGLYFVGIDVIGDKLVEINCVSPGGIQRINQLDSVRLGVAGIIRPATCVSSGL